MKRPRNTRERISRSVLTAFASVVVCTSARNVPVPTPSPPIALAYGGSVKARGGDVSAAADLNSYPPHLRAKIASSVAKGERRAREREGSSRETCPGCSRPPPLCLCDSLPPSGQLKTDTHIIVLQHPNEFRKKNFSTVPLMKMVLQEVTVKVGYTFDADALSLPCAFETTGRKPLLLYPSPGAVDLESIRTGQRDGSPADLSNVGNDIIWSGTECVTSSADVGNEGGNILIVVDGTWAEAKRMLRQSPALVDQCQTVQFASTDSPSLYHAVRKEPEEHCLSTLEACARALELLERPELGVPAVESLLNVLQRHVDSHISNAQNPMIRHIDASHKLYKKNRRRRQIEKKLFSGKDGGDKVIRPGSSSPGSVDQTITIVSDVTPIQLEDGSTIRPLQPSDAPLIDSWWEHQSAASLGTIARCISDDVGGLPACLGIETTDGSLRACILRYPGGALGLLHVEPSHRRCGYGSALLEQATMAVEGKGEPCWALILDGNDASEGLFAKLGFCREDPTLKKGSGKRRANRKWVKPIVS